MRIRKIDHILEKGSGKTNEDSLVIEKKLFGVFDGATSLSTGASSRQETGGAIAARTARDIFAKNHDPLHRLGQSANAAILDKMKTANVSVSKPCHCWSTSAAVVRIHENRLEWFQTGDASIMLIHEDRSHNILVDREDHDFDTLVMIQGAGNKTLSNPELRAQVEKVRAGMNKNYGVLNGAPEAGKFFNTGFSSLKGVSTVLLFTDGLNLPVTRPEKKKDFAPLSEKFQALGLSGLHHHIREKEKKDPERILYPRFKCHDDIAAIAIHLTPE